jgi:hypothetical protein
MMAVWSDVEEEIMILPTLEEAWGVYWSVFGKGKGLRAFYRKWFRSPFRKIEKGAQAC